MRVGIKAVLEDSKVCESRHQLNQMDATPIVALPNPFFWDVVSASSHPGSHPRHMEFGTTQSHEPHAHFDSSRQRFVPKSADGVPAKCRFEREVQAFGDRSFQEACPLMPQVVTEILSSSDQRGASGSTDTTENDQGLGLSKKRTESTRSLSLGTPVAT
jgi:hypothetical protein